MSFRMLRRLAGRLWNIAVGIWHGSITWIWFSVLFVGGIGMLSSGEFGGGLAVVWLSMVSLGSKYWHWCEDRSFLFKNTRFLVFPAIIMVAAILYFMANDMRGKSSWSHLPNAWNAMLIASSLRTDDFPERVWASPSIPSNLQKEAKPKPIRSIPTVVLQKEPTYGNLRERAIALSDSIHGDLDMLGWKHYVGGKPSPVGHFMPNSANDRREWDKRVSSFFHDRSLERVVEIRNEFSQFHMVDTELDENLITWTDVQKLPGGQLALADIKKTPNSELRVTFPREIETIELRLKALASQIPEDQQQSMPHQP